MYYPSNFFSMDQKISSLERFASNVLLIGIVFLLPILFVPMLAVPLGTTKIAFVYGIVIVAFFLTLIARLKKGSITIPLSPIVGAVWGLVIAYLIAALFSPNLAVSLVGSGAEMDTFAFITVMALLTSLIPLLILSKENIIRTYVFLLAAFLLLALFQASRLLFGANFFSFDIFSNNAGNLLGKWNDVGILFGLASIFSLITLEGLHLRRQARAIVYVVLAVSLFFLALVNFFVVWLLVGLFALGFFVYGIMKNRMRHRQETMIPGMSEDAVRSSKGGIPVVALLLLVITTIFILFNGTAGTYLSNRFNISYIEARPSWQSTIAIAENTYRENLVFGSGPNTFVKEWSAFKTRDLNETIFWNFDFTSGIGFVPTAFITTGIVGGALWLLFLGLFLWSGFKALVLKNSGRDSDGESILINYLTLSSFIGALYLWIMTIVYNPGVVLITLAFFLTGIFLASLRHRGLWCEKVISYDANPRLGFISVLLLTVLLIVSAVSFFIIGERYTSAVVFQRGLTAGNVEGDLTRAESEIRSAIRLYQSDRYYRTLVDINLAQINAVAGSGDALEEQQAFFQSHITSAVENAQQATIIDSGNYKNWMTLGRVYSSLVPLRIEGAYENAERVYGRARELNPHHPLIPYTLAQIEIIRGNRTAAKTLVNEALEKKSNYSAAIFLLSQIQIEEGDLDNAIRSVEAGALLNPQNPVVFFQLGLLYYNRGDNASAIAVFEHAISLDESYSNARYFLALAYARMERVEEAIAQFERIAELNPNNEEITTILENLRAGNSPFEPAGIPETIGDELPIEEE